MSKLTKKNFKIWLITGLSILLTALLVLSGVGIYFHFSKDKKKQNPTENVVPLLWSIDTWDGKSVSALEFNENYAGRGTTTKTINSAESFIHFINEVNNGKDFADYTIYLNSHIDLNGYTINSIGSEQNKFKGKFDGSYYTIQNAKINGNALFSYTEDATIENLGLYNCTIETGSNIAAGLIAKAVNTNINNTFVRLGKIASAQKVGGLVGEYVSNNGTHSIKNSFVDAELVGSDVGGLISSINTNNSSENEVTIENCYYTNVDKAYSLVDNSTFVNDDTNVVKATSLDEFKTNGFSYDANYDNNKDWTNYAYKPGSRELSFTYPVLRQYVKTFLKGSNYESVVVENGKATDASSFAEALEKATSNDVEINVIVEEVFVDEQAEAIDTDVTINVMKDTTIVRSEKNNESMFVATGTSKLVIGSEQTARSVETPKTITLDGNREHVEANNLESGALIVSNGNNVEIHSNVVLKDNINTTTGYGGAVLLYNTDEQAVVNATISNCYAENGGGGICVVGSAPKTLAGFSNCSTKGNGGGALIIDKLDDAEAVQTISKLYGYKANVKPLNNQFTNNNTTITTSSTYDIVGNSGLSGGAIHTYYNLTITGTSSLAVIFQGNLSRNSGGAIYVGGTLTANRVIFRDNYAGYMTDGYFNESTRKWDTEPSIDSSVTNASGGAVHMGEGTIISGTFERNTSSYDGGAISSFGALTCKDANFQDNIALKGDGGSIYIYNSSGENLLEDILCNEGKAGGKGGGICLDTQNNSTLKILDSSNYSRYCTFANCSSKEGGAIYSTGNQLNIYNYRFDTNTAELTGGAIYTTGGISSTYCTFIENKTSGQGQGGGAIYATDSTRPDYIIDYNFTACDFENNSSYMSGGAIYIYAKNRYTTLSFNSGFDYGASDWPGACYFKNNSAGDPGVNSMSGGAICFYLAAADGNIDNETGDEYEIYLNGVNFYENEATGNGGAVCAVNADLYIRDANEETEDGRSIWKNKAGENGGAIYVSNAYASITGIFEGNTTTAGDGGAIYKTGSSSNTSFDSTLYLGVSSFYDNHATIGNGGAVYSNYSNLIFDNNSTNYFNVNTSGGSGGAIWFDNGTISITNAEFNSNTAGGGGALHLRNEKTARNATVLTNCTFTSNQSTGNGGAILHSHTPLTLDACTFNTNHADGSGGAVWFGTNQKLLLKPNTTFTGNNSGKSGGAIFIDNASGKLTNNLTTFTYGGHGSGNAFTGNYAQGYGGTVYSRGNIDFGNITFNGVKEGDGYKTLATYGGSIYNENGTVLLVSCTFNNAIANAGGAIFTNGNETELITTKFYNCKALTSAGGAIYAHHISQIINLWVEAGCRFENCSSVKGGGAIYFDQTNSSSQLYMTWINPSSGGAENVFKNNTASNGSGGAILANSTSQTRVDALFEGNKAPNGSGGAVSATELWAKTCEFISNEAASGGAVRITKSSHFDQCYIFENNKALTGNGGAISVMPSNNETIKVRMDNQYELSFINNTAATSGGAICATGSNTTLDLFTEGFDRCQFIFQGNKSNTGNGGAIYCTNVVDLKNATFEENSAVNGGAIYTKHLKSDKVTYTSNFTFQNPNDLESYNAAGGAIYVGGGSCDIDNNTFTSNQAYSAGGAIAAIGAITTDVATTTFDQNKSGVGNVTLRAGGAIYGWSNDTANIGTLKLTNVNFTSNVATSDGGAIFTNGNINYTNTDATYGVITGNTAVNGSGGAIWSYNAEYANAVTFNLTGATNISNNTANNKGGGAILFTHDNENSTLNITAASGNALMPFKNNTATNGSGGAINTTAKLIVSGFEFDGNTSGGSGGAIDVEYNDTEVTNCVFTSNTASNGGGGAICARSNVTLTSVVFGSSTNNSLGNKALSGGAVFIENYKYENPTLTIINGGFYNNSVDHMGGAIYVAGNLQINDATDTTKHTDFIGNTAATSAGAIKAVHAYKTEDVVYDNIANIYRTNFDNNNVEYAISGGGAINATITLTVDNCTFNENAVQNKTDGTGRGGGAINAQKLTASNCTFTSNQAQTNGGAIYNIDDITVSNCTFTSNSTVDFELGPKYRLGGAISSTGVVSITGSDFTSNKATAAGALHVITDSTVTNTDFDSNETTEGAGGAFYVYDAIGTITFDNCNFKNNKAVGMGGAIYYYYYSKPATSLELHIKGGSFDNNSSMVGGAVHAQGQIYINSTKNGAVLATSTTFTRNRTTAEGGNGGALYLAGGVTNYISNATFGVINDATKKNIANNHGNAICSNSNSTLNNCNFYSHDVIETNYGGAIYSNGTLNIFGGEFDSNKSVYGGAIYSNGTLNINVNSANTQTKFTRNYSSNLGGAIYTLNTTNICNSIFGDSADSTMANKANGSGGAIDTHAVNPIIKNCEFYNNISVNGYRGGAISAHGDGEQSNVLTIDGGKFVGNNSHAIFARVPVVVNNGAIFENNTVNAKTNASQSTYGGAIYSTGDVTINGGSFKNNKAYNQGGAVWAGGNVSITGTEDSPVLFDGNSTDSIENVDNAGFAVYASEKANLTHANFINSHFALSDYNYDWYYNNSVIGGAVYAGNDVYLIGGLFKNNYGDYSQGPAGLLTKGTLYMNVNVQNGVVTKLSSHTLFDYNDTKAIWISSTNTSKIAYLNNFTIEESSSGAGGAAAISSNISTNIYNAIFDDNNMDSYAGIIYIAGNAVVDNSVFKLAQNNALNVTGTLTLTNSLITKTEENSYPIYNDYNVLMEADVINISNTTFRDLEIGQSGSSDEDFNYVSLIKANTINLGSGVVSENVNAFISYYDFDLKQQVEEIRPDLYVDFYLKENQVVNVVGELSQTYTVYKENVQPYSVENDNSSGLIAYSDPAYNIDWLNDINGKFTVTNIPEGYGLLYNSEFKPDYVIVSQGLEKPQWRDSGDTIYYDGRTKDVSDCLIGFDPTTMDITGHAEFDRGEHFVQVTPKAGYIWRDGTSSPAVYRWEIVMPEGFEGAELYLPSHFNYSSTRLLSFTAAGSAAIQDKSSYKLFVPDVTTDGGELEITGFMNSILREIAITQVYIPSSVTEVSYQLFDKCPYLQTVIFEEESKLTTIGDYAFSNTAITAIDIPETVTSIGDYAFQGCDFTTIKIPHGLTQINSGTFFNCTELENVEFAENNSLTLIKNESFYGCSKLNTISIPTTVTTIENYAFEYCTDLQSVTFGNTNVLTTIGDSVFLGCSSLTEITIPASVQTLGNGVFRACEKLATVTFETDSKLTTIGERAFQATALIEITIPKDVVTIGNYAFASCGALTTVTYHVNAELTTVGNNAFNNTSIKYMIFPNKVTSIGDGVFNTAEMLEFVVLPNNDITFGANMFSYTPKLNLIAANATRYAEYTTDGHALSVYESKLTYPVTLTYHYANDMTVVETKLYKRPVGWLKNENNIWLLTDFTLPATEGNSFWLYADGTIVNETNLNDKFVNGNVVDNINIYLTERQPIPIPVFNGDPFLYTGRNYNIADYIDNFDASFMALSGDYCEYDVGVHTVTMTLSDGYKFTDNTTVTTFTWGIGFPEGFNPDQDGDGVDDIVVLYLPEHFTFNGSTLTGLSDIGKQLCGNYKTDYIVVMPEVTTAGGTTEITVIGGYAFAYEHIENHWTNNVHLTNVYISKTIKTIGDYAFDGCQRLIEIEIPASVTTIGYKAFSYCYALTSVTFGDNSQLTEIDFGAFSSCISLTSIEIPASVTYIEGTPFDSCDNLISITVKAGNTYYHAKDNCLIETATNTLIVGCKNSIIPNYVTVIGDYAFYYCNLTSIEIPASVTTIGNEAFEDCQGLTSIEIPASVITIGNSAFRSCTSLTSIEIPASVTYIGDNPFAGCESLISITVEEGNTYYHAKDNCLIETATNTLISGCKNSIIPNYVTIIGDSAFYECSSLTSIEIPASVTTLGEYAFIFCRNLTSVTFAENSQLKEIGLQALSYIAIQTIEIPASVTIIGASAFYECSSLTSIEIPASVTTFGGSIGSIFTGCDNLVNIIAENADKYAEYTTEGHKLFEYVDKITYKVTLTYDYLEEESVVETKLYKRDIKWSKVDGVWTLLESFTLPELDENSCWIYEDGSEVTVENLNAKFTDGTVTNNITIYEKLNAVTINITVNDSTYGDITKNGTETKDSFEFKYVAGTTATPNGSTLTIGEDVYVAIPAESAQYDYIFKGWFEGETKITSAIELTANKNIIAVFEQKLKTFTLTVQSDDSEYGDLVISTGETVDVKTYTVNYGTNLTVNNNVLTVGEETITATPITSDVDGITYVFAGWFAGVEQITENYLVTSTTTIVAKFNKMITVTLNVTGNVTGENGNTYNVIVNDENQVKVGEYTDTFMLLADQTYTFKVSATLIADSANNEYQILNISMGEATKTIASPNVAGLNNNTLTDLMLTEPAEIKFEFLSAYTMKVNMEDVVESKTVTVTSGQLITDTVNNLYIIADDSVVSLEVNTVPTGAVEYKFTDITYVLNGETKTVSTNDANGDIKFISMEPPTNGNDYKEKTTGTYKYTISTEKISSITINLKEVVIMEEEVIDTNMDTVTETIKEAIIENNPQVDPDTILVDPFEIAATFTSEHNLTEVLDGESSSLHFYKGTWSVITEMTAIQLDAVLSLTDQGITIVTVDGDYDGLNNADAIVTAIIIP